ncbi:hypothetical protein SLS62_008089 [Diatrype stigma]|uniref:C2H2-type domain-containing protein n=1 Tax=Diatrype stigma TaxID=117547 RepID=A0AAN9UPP7_9PEZI
MHDYAPQPEPPQQVVRQPTQQSESPNNIWTYAVEVQPAYDQPGEDDVGQHTGAVQDAFRKKKIDYGFCITRPVEGNGVCRRYTIPLNIRDSERSRLDFLQIFNTNRRYNQALDGYQFKMSVVSYEPKHFTANTQTYPNVGADASHPNDAASAHHHHHHHHHATPFSPSALNHLMDEVGTYNHGGNASLLPPSPGDDGYLAPLTPPEQRASPSPGADARKGRKSVKFAEDVAPAKKTVVKPDRGTVEKNSDGLYECNFPGCKDPNRAFARKCEWGKHMDKHDRPYRCSMKGCEKMQGFTYSGGLLRHAREVHNDHGGPKNLLYCPHPNCKRHIGKGFTRLENLNEHLRRCHTSGDDDGGCVQGAPAAADNLINPDGALSAVRTERLGDKRKANDEDQDPRDEVKRLRGENQGLLGQIQDLRNQLDLAQRNSLHYQQNNEALKKQVMAMMSGMANGSADATPGNGNADPSTMTLFDQNVSGAYN